MDAHDFTGKIKFSATLTAEISKTSPVIMAGDCAERIRRASQLGYHAVELHWADPRKIPLDEIVSACENYNMKISAFATGRAYFQEGLNLTHDDDNIRKASIERVFGFVDAAARCDAVVIIGCIRGNIPAGEPDDVYLRRFAHSIHTVAKYAESRNVGIVLEAINRYENNYLNTAKETADFISEFALPNVKILLDTFHMNIEETSPAEAITDCAGHLGYIHIADSNRRYAGAGHIDFRKIAAAVYAAGYQGYISAECLPLPDSETALSNWIKEIKDVFSIT